MRLVVNTTSMRTSEFGNTNVKRYHEGTVDYRTTPEGELDVLDDGIVIATYNKTGWESISREKGSNEEWPEALREEQREEENGESESEPRIEIGGCF